MNWGPQGPSAMPPRQGQFQFISPVSSLKAPSWVAWASVAEGSRGEGEGGGDEEGSSLVAMDAAGVGAGVDD